MGTKPSVPGEAAPREDLAPPERLRRCSCQSLRYSWVRESIFKPVVFQPRVFGVPAPVPAVWAAMAPVLVTAAAAAQALLDEGVQHRAAREEVSHCGAD